MERRGAQRIEYVCEVECEGATPDPVRPRMRDLSATGAFIESSVPAPEGARLILRFLLPSGEIAVAAEVARLADQGMGVRFLGLSADERRLIEAAVAEEASAP